MDELLTRLCDTRQAYEQAFAHIDGCNARKHCYLATRERDTYIRGINAVLARHDLPLKVSMTINEAFREAWQGALALFSPTQNQRILSACLTLEGLALDSYERVIQLSVPDELLKLLTERRDHVASDIQKLQSQGVSVSQSSGTTWLALS